MTVVLTIPGPVIAGVVGALMWAVVFGLWTVVRRIG